MIEGVLKTKLRTIQIETDYLRDIIKKNQLKNKKFGEIYISTISYKKIRAWKKQIKITQNLVVPHGKVKITLVDDRKNSKTYKKKQIVTLTENPYFRLTIPPNIWYGFEGISRNFSMIVAVTDYLFNEKDVIRKKYKK